ncbi:MAG: DUF3306 domain-containing protein [Burkholderiales bacterium]|nr:DUF3306 domain-containing protein [Burkholderiales bacterium]
MADEQASGFLSRWARRKEQVRSGVAVAPEAVVETPVAVAPVAPLVAKVEAPAVEEAPAAEPMPTMADVALLTRQSDYSRFVSPGIDEGVKRAAMKKLFTDPHFNVMDGLDTYIDDYGKPDPIPLAMLKQMNQSKVLRLFDVEDEEDDRKKSERAETPLIEPATEPVTELKPPPDDDPDLRLQQDDAAGRPGPDQGARA